MAEIIINNISLILLLPLWIFLIIMCGRFFSVYVNKRIIYGLTLLGSFAGALMCFVSLFNINDTIEWGVPFIKINDFVISFGLHVDRLSLIFALILFLVSFVVQWFSISYMSEEKKNYRFYALLNLFNFGMAFMLFSSNLFQMYVFWEIIGIVSYLLIGFDYSKQQKSIASKRVFIINRIGDTALISGIILVSYFMYSYSGNNSFVSLSIADLNALSTVLFAYTSYPIFLIICGLFLFGAVVKSAQFPFHIWLQDAMEAKLPVSALLHSATMVAAGVYLGIRCLPFFTLSPMFMNIIALIGITTALICSFLAILETNNKKILAYSTSANLGLMFFGLGMYNIKAVLVLFIAHAFIKSMMFLLLPKDDNKISQGGFTLFCIGGLSLAGILFAGLSAKEFLYDFIQQPFISNTFLVVCFLTAVYVVRLCLIIGKNSEIIKKINLGEFLPQCVLLILNILLYALISKKIGLPFFVGITGVIFTVILSKFMLKLPEKPIIIESICYRFAPYVYDKVSNLANAIDVRILGNYKPIIFISKLFVKTVNWVEINIMNRSVSLTAEASKKFSSLDMKLQSKNVQTYNAYAFVIITVIITLVIIGYTFIMSIMK